MKEIIALAKEITAKSSGDLPHLGKPKDEVNRISKEIPSYRQIKEIIQIKHESPFSGKLNECIRNVNE